MMGLDLNNMTPSPQSSCKSEGSPKLMNSSSNSVTALVPGGVVTTQNISTVIKPKGNNNSLQFVKIQTPELSKKAVEQIKLAEDSKISKEKIKEVEEDWQNNLLNWKSKRRQQFNFTSDNEQNNPFDTSVDSNGGRKVKTFAEMIEQRAKSGNRLGFHLQRYLSADEDEEKPLPTTKPVESSNPKPSDEIDHHTAIDVVEKEQQLSPSETLPSQNKPMVKKDEDRSHSIPNRSVSVSAIVKSLSQMNTDNSNQRVQDNFKQINMVQKPLPNPRPESNSRTVPPIQNNNNIIFNNISNKSFDNQTTNVVQQPRSIVNQPLPESPKSIPIQRRPVREEKESTAFSISGRSSSDEEDAEEKPLPTTKVVETSHPKPNETNHYSRMNVQKGQQSSPRETITTPNKPAVKKDDNRLQSTPNRSISVSSVDKSLSQISIDNSIQRVQDSFKQVNIVQKPVPNPRPESTSKNVPTTQNNNNIIFNNNSNKNFNNQATNVVQKPRSIKSQPLPESPKSTPIQRRLAREEKDRTVLSVSGKKRCSSCKEELGRGSAAFVVESLCLVYHTNCFRCSVCHVNLSNGFQGVDVRVHAGALHCQNCYSKDGLNYSRV